MPNSVPLQQLRTVSIMLAKKQRVARQRLQRGAREAFERELREAVRVMRLRKKRRQRKVSVVVKRANDALNDEERAIADDAEAVKSVVEAITTATIKAAGTSKRKRKAHRDLINSHLNRLKRLKTTQKEEVAQFVQAAKEKMAAHKVQFGFGGKACALRPIFRVALCINISY